MKSDRSARSVPADRHAVACGGVQADPPAVTEGSAAADLLTSAEAARFLKLTLGGFYAWRRRHGIRSAIPGRALRFRVDDLLIAKAPTDARVLNFAALGRQHARDEEARRGA